MKNIDWNRSAIVLAGLSLAYGLLTWSINTYVQDPSLAEVLRDGVFGLAVATGVVTNTRKK